MNSFSDYIVFVDETGDHSLQSIDPDYPLFGLAFCIIKKEDYLNIISPYIQRLKLDFWGHDNVILHEHDIRKEKGDFAFLRANRNVRETFMSRLNEIVELSPFHIVSAVIDKVKLKQRYSDPWSPYEVALLFCMEKTLGFLCSNDQNGRSVHIIFEGRGKKEDNDLELEFRRICDNENWGYKRRDFKKANFEAVFSQKSLNVAGLQLADLVARPICINYLRPAQDNRAYSIISSKIYGGTKCFP